uniref:Uncharacterized protein n=1 Tax=Amazona collaria TaxID=241587 RepID=A0A8B9GAU3_9PSIT
VLPIQPVCFLTRDEELGAVDGSTWPRVFQNEVFIIELLPIDGFAPGAVVVGEVASLAHELGDDAVEAAPFEAKAFLVGAEAAEILCEDLQPPRGFVSDLDLHENLRVCPGFLGRRLTLSRKRKQGAGMTFLCFVSRGS